MKKSILKVFLLLSIFFTIYSCEEDCNHLSFLGDETAIVSFSFENGEIEYPVRITSDSLVFDVAYGFDFTDLTPDIVVSEGAVISPDPATIEDWSANVEFTVMSANKQVSRQYKYVANVANYEKVYNKVALLRTQTEVDAFAAEQYTKVYSIVIDSEEEDKIIDLSSLNTIEEISYNLKIQGFYGKTLDGFENLKKITTFNLNNDSVSNVSFPNLEVATNFMIGYLNDEYAGFKSEVNEISCPKLTTVYNDFIIGSRVRNFIGFSNLSEVGGEIVLGGTFTNLKGLEKLTKVNYLTINSLDFTSFEGLENLKTVRKTFELSMCQNLEKLDGLQLENVSEIRITGCTRLKNILALHKITELDNLNISGSLFLESLEGLHNLKTIRKDLIIIKMARMDWTTTPPTPHGIKNLNGLRSLESIGRNFVIKQCYLLEDYSGLSGVKGPLAGEWQVADNAYNPTKEQFLAGKYTKE